MKIRNNKIDLVFSKLIRARDGCCVKCGNSGRVECSHIFSRRHVATRWDPINAKALCHYCHRYWWHSDVAEAGEWIKGYLGESVYEDLKRKAHTPVKLTARDKEDIYQDLKARLDLLESTGVWRD